MGRPSDFTQDIADAICERLADGRSLRSICEAGDMPSKTTVMRWLQDEDRQAFRDQYARAREAQADAFFDDIIQIADDGSNDTYTDGDGKQVVDHDHIARSRLRVDARKWAASKLAPKKYGEKIALTGDGGGPVEHRVTTMSDEELERIAAGRGS